jgi:hypothetical protein
MRAADVIRFDDVLEPVLGREQMLVRVHATCVREPRGDDPGSSTASLVETARTLGAH